MSYLWTLPAEFSRARISTRHDTNMSELLRTPLDRSGAQQEVGVGGRGVGSAEHVERAVAQRDGGRVLQAVGGGEYGRRRAVAADAYDRVGAVERGQDLVPAAGEGEVVDASQIRRPDPD